MLGGHWSSTTTGHSFRQSHLLVSYVDHIEGHAASAQLISQPITSWITVACAVVNIPLHEDCWSILQGPKLRQLPSWKIFLYWTFASAAWPSVHVLTWHCVIIAISASDVNFGKVVCKHYLTRHWVHFQMVLLVSHQRGIQLQLLKE